MFEPEAPNGERVPGRVCHGVIAQVSASGRAVVSVLHTHGTWGPRVSVPYDKTGRTHDSWHFPEDEQA